MSPNCNTFVGTVSMLAFRISNMSTRTLVPGLSQLSVALRSLRKEHGFSLRELDQITGISWGTLAGWENDRVKNISADAVGSLSRAYGMTTLELMRRIGVPVREAAALEKQPPDSTATKQPELYQGRAPRVVPHVMVRVAEVTIAAGLESWRTLVEIPVSAELVGGRRDVIYVEVTGDCLDPEIQSGDMALIDLENLSPRSGAMVAVLLEDGQLVMKRFSISRDDGKPILTDNKGTTIRPNGAKIVGTVIHVSRTVY